MEWCSLLTVADQKRGGRDGVQGAVLKPAIISVESLVISAGKKSGYEGLSLGHHRRPLIGLCGNYCGQ